MAATDSRSLYPSAHPQHAYALAILCGGVAYILPQTGIRIGQWLVYVLVGAIFGSIWPRKALQWGIWISLPIAMLVGVDFFASWNIFVVLGSVFVLVKTVLFTCAGAYIGSKLSVSRLGRWIARNRGTLDTRERPMFASAALRGTTIEAVAKSSRRNGSGDGDARARLRAALIKAVRENNPVSLNRLIAVGADVNERSLDRVTQLMASPLGPDSGVMNTLFGTGSATGSDDGQGWTPLMLATIEGHVEIVRALLENRADVDAENNEGWTALRFAVSMDETRILGMLLDAGADPNIIDHQGRTALMQAAAENILASLNLLLEAGGDPHHRDSAGQTAIAIAQAHGHREAARILQQFASTMPCTERQPPSVVPLTGPLNTHRVITMRRDQYVGLIDRFDVILTESALPRGWEETGRAGPEEECREYAWKHNIVEPSELGWWLVFSN